MMQITPFTFGDNRNYLLRSGDAVGMVDSSDSPTLFSRLNASGLKLTHLFLTHHHHDHVNGLFELLRAFPKVQLVKPAGEHRILPEAIEMEGKTGALPFGKVTFSAFLTTAHTAHSLVYRFDQEHCFTGDALFEAGCGRSFEGKGADLEAAMDAFLSLPEQTQLYVGHDYGEVNLRFALSIEPDNRHIQQALLSKKHQSTWQSAGSLWLSKEKKVNPFLRIDAPQVIHTLDPKGKLTRAERYGRLRRLRDSFV